MVVAYKKEKWDDPNYEPLDDESYSDDETYNPTYKDGKIIFRLDKNSKKDDGDEKNETKCKETQLYLTLTNKMNPLKPETALAEERLGSSLTQVSDSADQNIAMVVAGAVSSAAFVAVKYIFGLALLSLYFLIWIDIKYLL